MRSRGNYKTAINWPLYMSFVHLYIYIYMGWVQVTPGITLSNVTPLNIF